MNMLASALAEQLLEPIARGNKRLCYMVDLQSK